MPLKMRSSSLGSGYYKDVPDYGIYCGEWCIGRIYENSSVPEDQRWYWTLHAPGGPVNLPPSNHVASLEAAKAEFETAWKRWKAWARLEEVGTEPTSAT